MVCRLALSDANLLTLIYFASFGLRNGRHNHAYEGMSDRHTHLRSAPLPGGNHPASLVRNCQICSETSGPAPSSLPVQWSRYCRSDVRLGGHDCLLLPVALPAIYRHFPALQVYVSTAGRPVFP